MKIKQLLLILAVLSLSPLSRAETWKHEFKFFVRGSVVKVTAVLDFYDGNKVELLITDFPGLPDGCYAPLFDGTEEGSRLVFDEGLTVRVVKREPLTLSVLEPELLLDFVPSDNKVAMKRCDIPFSDALVGTTWEALTLAERTDPDAGTTKYMKAVNRITFDSRFSCTRFTSDDDAVAFGSYSFDGVRLYCQPPYEMALYDAQARTITFVDDKTVYHSVTAPTSGLGGFTPEDLRLAFDDYREMTIENRYVGSTTQVYVAVRQPEPDEKYCCMVDKEGTILMPERHFIEEIYDARVTEGGFLIVVGKSMWSTGKSLYGGEGDLSREFVTDCDDIRLEGDGVVFFRDGKTEKMSYLDVYDKLYVPALSDEDPTEEAW